MTVKKKCGKSKKAAKSGSGFPVLIPAAGAGADHSDFRAHSEAMNIPITEGSNSDPPVIPAAAAAPGTDHLEPMNIPITEGNTSDPPVKNYQITDGSVKDVKFIGPTGQKEWMGVELQDFYVIIPSETVLMFRRPSEPQFSLDPQDIVDHLKACPNIKVSPGAKLFFKGLEVPADEDMARFPIPKAAFILDQYTDPAHSGKLFSCLNPTCNDFFHQGRGWNRLQKFEKHHPTVRSTRTDWNAWN